MRFPETHAFTALVQRRLTEDEYRRLQLALASQPKLGPVIRGTGRLRKLRWSAAGRGKRGGVRVIYAWDARSETFFMLYVFAKNERSDLTTAQRRTLGQIVRKELG